jgi:hypothetical protein
MSGTAGGAEPRAFLTPAELLQHHGEKLRPWERKFLSELVAQKRGWTWKQHRNFDAIHARMMRQPT